MQETQLLGTGYQQEVHLEKLYADVAEYDVMVHVPAQIPTLVDLAVRHALARRRCHTSPSRTTCRSPTPTATRGQGVAPARAPATAPVFIRAPGRPARHDLHAAADVLNARRRVVVLAGAGALRRAATRCSTVAERLGGPIVKTLPGKARRARRPPAHHRWDRPARDAAVGGGDGGVRHAVHGRHELSRTRSTCPSPGRCRSCRSRSIRYAPGTACRPGAAGR